MRRRLGRAIWRLISGNPLGFVLAASLLGMVIPIAVIGISSGIREAVAASIAMLCLALFLAYILINPSALEGGSR